MPAFSHGTSLNTLRRHTSGKQEQYLRIKAGPQRDRYVHQLVAEALLGRPLASNEEVDHLDGNTLNNEFTNLRVLTVEQHAIVTRRRSRARQGQQSVE